MRFAILGPVELRHEGRPQAVGGPTQVALLAFLLLHANRPLSSDRLCAALWPDGERSRSLKQLHVAVCRLRKSLGAPVGGEAAPVLRSVRHGYALTVAQGELDADVFKHGVAAGGALLDGGDPAGASEVLRSALALWRGSPLAGVDCSPFATGEIRHLEELRLDAIDSRFEADLSLGRHRDVLGELQQLSEHEPHDERVCRQLMLALYGCGRQLDALEAYTRLGKSLLDDLGMHPGPILQSVQRSILEQDASLSLAPGGPSTRPTSPSGDVQPPKIPANVAAVPAYELPWGLRSAEPETFVGRDGAMAQLTRCYERVASGRRRVALLCGEPGVGKSRLAREFAQQAHDGGAIVLYGRCDEEGLLPHKPFVEALREYLHSCDPSLLAGHVGLISGELRRVVPELAERLPELAEPLSGDPEGARHRLFEAVAALLCDIARRGPVVLIIDDLHWADVATLLLLKYVARYRCGSQLMIVGTYRDMEVERDHPLAGVLADLAREQLSERIELGCLDEDAVRALVGWHTAGRGCPLLKRMVFERTAGNPFFVVETLRHLQEDDEARANAGGWELPLSEGVRTLVGRRLMRLGPDTERVLATASVLGQAFALDMLEQLCDLTQDELVSALEGAVGARVVDEVPGRIGHYAFAHALIRDVQYGLLTATRRAVIHRRAATAIEKLNAGEEGAHLAELAYHFGHAPSGEDLDKAIDYAARAGQRDVELLAYEQAAAHYRHALELLDARGATKRQAVRCELTIALGEAEHMAGDPAYRHTLLDAARAARQLGDVDRLSRAARANNRGLFSSSQGIDHARVAVVVAATEAVAGQVSATHASLLAQLAVELGAGADWRERARLADRAVAMARRAGDRDTLAHTLAMRALATWGPQTFAERNADLREAWRIAEGSDDRVLAAHVAYVGYDAALTAGDLDRADRLLERLGTLADQLGQPIIEWNAAVSQAKRCLAGAAPQAAERLAVAALEIGRRAAQPHAEAWCLGTLVAARFVQGTLDTGEPHLPTLVEQPGFAPPVVPEFTPSRSIPLLVTAAKSAILCEVGRLDGGRAHFDVFAAELRRLPNDFSTLPSLAYAAVACAHLRDERRAAQIIALLEPRGEQFVNVWGAWFGAVRHYVAMLHASIGAWSLADAGFAATERAYERLGATAWLARCRLDRATALLGAGGCGDLERSRKLLEQVLAAARRHGFDALGERAAALLPELAVV